MAFPVVHRFEGSLFPVNAYLVELPDEVIVIDSTLGMSDGRALRARVDTTGRRSSPNSLPCPSNARRRRR